MAGRALWYEGQRSRLEMPSSVDHSPSTQTVNSWKVAAGVFLIQLTVPITFYSYGVFLSHLVERHRLRAWHGLLPAMTYIVTRCFADPICRKILSGQSHNSVPTTFGGVLLIAGGISVNGFLETVLTEVLTLGVLIGVCTSVVVTQAEAVLYCHFPSRNGFRKILCLLASALALFGAPLLMNGLILKYGIYGGFLLQSGIILHGLAGALLLSPPKEGSFHVKYTRRPRTYTVVNDVELVDFSHVLDSGNSGHSPLLSSGRSWRNPGSMSDTRPSIAQTSSPIFAVRHKTVNGVDILPRIPEEHEENDDDDDDDDDDNDDGDDSKHDSSSSSDSSNNWHLYTKTTNRWGEPYTTRHHEESKKNNSLSDRYPHERRKGLKRNSLHKWKNANLSNMKNETLHEVKHMPKEAIEIKSNERSSDESISLVLENNETERRLSSTNAPQDPGSLSCFQRICGRFQCKCEAKQCFYNGYIAVLNIPNDLYFYMIVPFINAMKVPGFLPSVFTYMLLHLCPVLFATFAPLLSRSRVTKSTFQEGAFIVTVAAFGFLCFTLLTPCLSGVKIVGQKLTYFCGSLLIATGLYLISSTRTHGQFTLGSALFGFGVGASTATVTKILETDLGMRDFVRIQGPMDAVSGLFIILTAVLLGFLLQEENGMESCFVTLMVLQLVSGTMWMLSLLKPLSSKIQCLPHSEWHSGGLIAQVH